MIKQRLTKLRTFLYDCFLIFAFAVALPKILYKRFVHGKYKKSLKIRFGLEKPQVSGKGPVVWFHGASVGEVALLVPLVQRFMKDYPQWHCVVTACTEAGNETAERLFGPMGATTFILPLDLSLIIKPVVRAISPSLLVFSEGDCWLNLLEEAKRLGATAIVINGKLSVNSCKWFTVLKRFGRNYFSPIDGFLLQDDQHKARFLRLGVDEKKIEVTGNIKTYTEISSENNQRNYWREKLQLSQDTELLVLGSIHPKDIDAWIPLMRQLRHRNIKVLWVPRHIERSKELENLLLKENISYGLWSQEVTFDKHDAIIVDAIGWLKQLYFAADLAFVGGTFDDKVGGHNLLEPLQCGVPLIFGPCITSQSDLAQRLLSLGAGCRVDEKNMLEIVTSLLDHPEERMVYVQKGKAFLYEERAAFDRTWESFKRYIPCAKM
ncbi:lipid IV(A) 3-deoxy-D-manno-octulosonic acid transferase [Chlamydia caviae]|uniref:3-deoxy-D-manno-octulosonic acid transferase n=1 Tax=Chlamydia caviae (strain ATCC VR-813 / DSM 19441 / 03DC25 / GPIC) TaxID=227941 RepID=Q822R8_CHLCV|nr:lipid IV(A) 3-deoxy-D-manno-octulosonic acid transferase [Chlamydia caviae]AAP05353.1 3-deoxy-D-manno-2-octulosonic acid transferase [Chlamydia caviae GPIC]